MTADYWTAGTEVRLISDPGSTGICTGITRQRADVLLVQVAFPGLGKTFQPEYELERVSDASGNPYELLREGAYGSATHLRRNLTHIQLSGKLANLVYSMETTETEFYAYQYKPVLAFLESPSNGLLIADEVGLGKTIEAGLIWTELRVRSDARRLVVVCKAMLREKWKMELARRFGVDAEICNANEFLAYLRRPKHEIAEGKAVVCSIQGIRPPRGWREEDAEADGSSQRKLARFLMEQADRDPLIDLLVIDEAHYLRNPESLACKLGHLLREVSEHVVLLSATPVNLSSDDLFTLLNLADPDTFAHKEFFPEILQRNAPLLKAREIALSVTSTEDDIKTLLKQSLDPYGLGIPSEETESRSLSALLELPMPPEYLKDRNNRVKLANRIERLNLLGHAVNRTRKAEVTEFRRIRRPKTESVPMTQAETNLYTRVTDSIREYAAMRDISDGFLLAAPQRQVSSCMVAAVRSWRKRDRNFAELIYENFDAEVEKTDAAPLIETLVREVLPDIDVKELERNDSKYQRLSAVLIAHFNENPSDKIILFSYFRATLHYLRERLEAEGIRCALLMGGMAGSKQSVIDTFQQAADVRVLLSSEVAAEGVDLQFSRILVNYDLPWNPMSVEQRIGRIDRIGQEADSIVIWNLCAQGTIDERILTRLYERLQIFERALGGFEEILGEHIQELTTALLSRKLTANEETQQIEQTATAIANIREQQEQLEAQASNLIAHGGYVLDAVNAAREFSHRINEHDIYVYVRDYLERYAEGYTLRSIEGDAGEFELQLPFGLATRLGEFIRTRRLSGYTRLVSGEAQRCKFVNKVRLRSGAVEWISQFHPLVRFISEELKQKGEAIYPVYAVRLGREVASLPQENGQYAFVVRRWHFTGLRTEEELRARAVSVGQGVALGAQDALNLVNHGRTYGDEWLAARSEVDCEAVIQAIDRASELLDDDYRVASAEKENENFDRIELQKQSLRRHRERRLARLEQLLESYRFQGKTRLIPATEGQIRSLNRGIEKKLEELTQKTQLNRSQFDVAIGVIDVR